VKKKYIKKLKQTVRSIQVEWLRTLLSEEDGKQININNINGFLADQTHTFINGQFELSFMSSRWILKQLKRNPKIKTYEQLMEFNNEHNKRNAYG